MATAPSAQVSAALVLKVQSPPVWMESRYIALEWALRERIELKARGAREYRQRGCQEAVVRMGLVSAPLSRPTKAGLFVRLGRGHE